MVKRGVLLSIIFSLALTIMLPFSISANGSLAAPFVGFNCNFIDINFDEEYETSISGSSGSYSGNVAKHSASVTMTGDINLIERTASGITYNTTAATNGKANYTGSISENAASESGTISLNLSSSSIAHYSESALLELEIILDNNYIGYIDLTIKNRSTSVNSRTVYVNGNSQSVTIPLEGAYSNAAISDYSIVIDSFDLTNNIERMWNFPIESYPVIKYVMEWDWPIVSLWNYNYYSYPIFNLTGGNTTRVLRYNSVPANANVLLICWSNRNFTASTFTNYFDIGSSFTVDHVDIVSTLSSSYIRRVYIKNSSSSATNLYVDYKYSSDILFIPFYFFREQSDYYNVSNDFALEFGIENKLIHDLGLLANGTTGSNQAASNVTNESSNLTEVSEDIHDMESNFNSDLNTNLQAIDTTITPGTFGSSFLSSASWVKTQFDQLTSNTPFGSVLSFSLVLGLGLLIVGRALK